MESPCIKVCAVDRDSGRCLGCGRTLAQIAGWASFAPAERRRIMNELRHFNGSGTAATEGAGQ